MPADKSLKDLSGSVVKIAESYPKIQKDVKDLRDAICGPGGILESVDLIARNLNQENKKEQLRNLGGKQRTNDVFNKNLVSNTGSINKTLNKILDRMKGMPSGGKGVNSKMTRLKDGDFHMSVNVLDKLRGIKMKDFLLAKTKLNLLKGILKKSLRIFNGFKNKEEAENTLGFINSSVEITNKLVKVGKTSRLSQKGAKTLETIYLGKRGKGGLVKVFQTVSKNRRNIERGKKSISDIHKSTGSMLLTSIILTGIAVVGIPAMAGALLMKGIIWLLIGTFKMLRKAGKSVIKGSAVLLLMSASIISFGLGLAVMAKAVKDMKLKDVGLMVASLAGMGLTIAGVGLLAVPIAIGSATLLLMGASLGIFGLALLAWRNMDAKKSIGNVKLAIEGLREAFGLELGKGDEKKGVFKRLTGGVLDIAMGLLNFGKTFFIMGSLLLTGFALGMLYKGLKKWDNFNGEKAASNIKTAVGALKEAFGIGDTKEGFGNKLKKLVGGPLEMGIAIMQGGKALAEMGVITIATGLSDMIRLFLIPWNKYDARPAAKNLKIAVDALKDVFGLNDNNRGIFGKIGKLIGSTLDMGTALMNSGGVLTKMGTITIATGMADIIRLELKPWENYDASKPISNMEYAINSIIDLFGLKNESKGLFNKLGNLVGSMFDMGVALMNSGGVLAKMGTITIATAMLSKIKEYLEPWTDYNSSKPIANVKIAVDNLLDVFGLTKMRKEETAEVENNGFWGKVGNGLKKVGNVISDAFNTASNLVETASSMAEGGKLMAKMSSIFHATSAMFSIRGALEPWDNYNSSSAISNIQDAVRGINGLYSQIKSIRDNEPRGLKFSNAQYFEISTESLKRGINNLADSWRSSEILKTSEVPFKKTVDIINALDVTKASVMIDLFKSFSKINKKPFDKFTSAVNTFAESSSDLIDALNNFSRNYNPGSVDSGESTESTGGNVNGVTINNAQDLATAIANAIKSLPVNIENTMSDIRLVVNNEAGRRVVLTLEN